MFNLIKNEWIKIFAKKSVYIMFGLVVLITIALAFLINFLDSMNSHSNDGNWKENLQAQNQQYRMQLDEIGSVHVSIGKNIEAQMAMNEYRIENDIPPVSASNMWTFIFDSTENMNIIGLFVIIIAGGIVANEFSQGTIKSLLTRPYKRWKILLSKYITTLLFMVVMIATLFISSAIIGAIFFGFGGEGSHIHLSYIEGEVVEQNLFLHLIKVYLFSSINALLLVTMAFMISSVFRASGLAIGLSIFLLLAGGTATQILAGYFDWAKYILFANTNLMQYIDGIPMVEGMTMSFSVIVLLIYFTLFIALAFFFFTKRDVTA